MNPQPSPAAADAGGCCDDPGCGDGGGGVDRLAGKNFFLPAGLRASFRNSLRMSRGAKLQSTRKSSTASLPKEEEAAAPPPQSIGGGGGCCDDANCGGGGGGGRLAGMNFFLPEGLSASIRGSFRTITRNTSPSQRPGLERRSSVRDSIADLGASASRTAIAVAGAFDAESSRRASSVRFLVGSASSAACEPILAESGPDVVSRVGRSQIVAGGICCSSEVPAVQSILLPIAGVEGVSVSPAVKTIYVDHDIDIVSASDLCDALNEGGFDSRIVRDAAVEMVQRSGIPTDVTVTSVFGVVLSSAGTSNKVGIDRSETDEGFNSFLDLLEAPSPASGEANSTEVSAVPDGNENSVDVMKAYLMDKFSNEHIIHVALNESKGILTLEHNPYFVTASQISTALNNGGHVVSIQTDGGAGGLWAISLIKEDDGGDAIEVQKSTVRPSVILSGVLWVVSLLSYIGGNWEYLKYVALLSIAFGLPPIAIKAYRTMRRRKFDVNCMMLFAVIGAVALQDYTEAAAVTFLFAISEWLESLATARARNALSAIVSLRPERANLINPVTKDIVVLPASAVPVGSAVSVRTGDKIPCDGIIIEGSSTVDESNLTGESRPVKKIPGTKVSGGTINTGSTRLVVRSTASSNDSAVARLIRLVEDAQVNRSETEKMIDSFAQVYTPFVVMTALCMCTIPWAFGEEIGRKWLYNGLIVIVIACPCALIISTPVTYVAGLAAAAQMGVIIKGGQHLETLGTTRRIAFDKTGTLSEGLFQLLHFEVIGEGRDRKGVLRYLAMMEAPASHPLADAIVKGAANENVDLPKNIRVQDHTLLPGEGIEGIIEGKKVFVGNNRLFERLRLYQKLSNDDAAMTDKWARAGGTTGFISIEGEGIIGSYCVADKVRPEASDVIKELKKLGIDITMLTGDQRTAAVGVGSQVGLEESDIKSDLLPQDKLTFIREAVESNRQQKKWWQPKRAIMMVGDGVNDAPSLALADVSVAMGEGAALALETSDVTLMDSSLDKLLYIIQMGPRVIRTILENVIFSFAVKAIVVGFTFAGKASLWAAIASDVGAMLVVTLNGMKLLSSRKKVEENDPVEKTIVLHRSTRYAGG